MNSTLILEHSPSIHKPTERSLHLEKKKAEEDFGPGPANYSPDNYSKYIKRMSLVPAKVKRPTIARLNITLKLYDPHWEGGLVGS
jgi:hypothetical protein